MEVRVSQDLDLAGLFRILFMVATLLDCVIVSDCSPNVTDALPNNADRMLTAYSRGSTHGFQVLQSERPPFCEKVKQEYSQDVG